MKILVFGKSGQVARELQRHGDVVALSRDQANLLDPQACADIISQSDADIIINAAAYTAVDQAEIDEDMATTINAHAPAHMARAAAKLDLPFLHISSDYVFDGSGGTAWSVDDKVNPLNAYGRGKLLGEQGINAAGGRFAILRTSWVFSAHGNNFVKTMLRLGKERDGLNIVNDQIGGPTAAGDIAKMLLIMAVQMQNKNKSGIYHYSGAPDVSWAEFASEIFRQANLKVKVSGIASAEYPTPATRPLNSRLDCERISKDFGITRPDWKASLTEVLTELGEI